MKKILVLLFSMWASCCMAWPTQPITVIVPFPPGGIADQIVRYIQPDLESVFQVPVLVKNLPGSAHSNAINYILNQKNNHHTFLIATEDFISANSAQKISNYQNFKPINIIGMADLVFFGGKQASLTTLQTQIKNKSTVNVGVNGVGGSADTWLANLKSNMTINPVPYKGGAPLITDVISGHIEYGVVSIVLASPYIKQGLLKPLMTSNARSNSIVSYKKLEFDGDAGGLWWGFFVRNDTSDIAVSTFGKTVQQVIANNKQIQTLIESGFELTNLDSTQAVKFVDLEIKKYESRSIKLN